MLSDILLPLIICSAFCVLIGMIIAIVYVVKLARGKHILERELCSYIQMRKSEIRVKEESMAIESEAATHNEGTIQ
jgi:hypothetical protein